MLGNLLGLVTNVTRVVTAPIEVTATATSTLVKPLTDELESLIKEMQELIEQETYK